MGSHDWLSWEKGIHLDASCGRRLVLRDANFWLCQRQLSLHQAWTEWVAKLFEWNLFVTLTYDQKRPSPEGVAPCSLARPPHVEAMCEDVSHWLHWLKHELRQGRHVYAVVGIERQKSGWPHAHAVIYAPDLTSDDRRAMYRRWWSRHGYAAIEQPKNVSDVVNYVTKHFAEDATVILIWPRHAFARHVRKGQSVSVDLTSTVAPRECLTAPGAASLPPTFETEVE